MWKLTNRPVECLILYMNTKGAVASALVVMLLFSDICDPLEQLSSFPSAYQTEAITKEWFGRHVDRLQLSTESLALLSCVMPARRYDRVYGLGEKRIARIAAKAKEIGTSRQRELERMRKEENLDYATAVMKAVEECGAQNSSRASLTITELDHTLDQVAAWCDFSDVKLRKRYPQLDRASLSSQLTSMFQRMSSLEVKWVMRLLLKDLTPAIVPQELMVELVHPSLPSVLSMLDSFPEALSHLQERDSTWLGQTRPMVPQAGTRVSLPLFKKARSIKHGHSLMRGQEVSVERKYDGEYCQVHLWQDSNSRKPVIQLFSKSGRDSTRDRDPILPTIRKYFGAGRSADRVQKHCILVGELVVWNDVDRKIMPFYKIRRHVTRAGRRLGCQRDSSTDPDEHLMIVFHDILLWDDHICIYETYRQRRQHLQKLVQPVPGRAAIGQQVVLDFTAARGTSALACEMAYALSQRWEGLVLKACGDPYIDVDGRVTQYVKAKKDYIPGLGDSVDLLVIGGRCDPVVVAGLALVPSTWTTFFLACPYVDRENGGIEVSPSFHIVGTVSRPSISMSDIQFLNAHGRLSQRHYSRRD
ncbi:hypothetical protein OHC33_003005 [Knufia fluminis]|uniref:ATP-dependent DNA ligase family profile domain-containing protein n=1 Tax=Knufia fluminis TaxID=191047 RepID=A0AAN8F4E9_9EURO|nr:hypothetical protein OHC33_003005 [Knufia fluminis]